MPVRIVAHRGEGQAVPKETGKTFVALLAAAVVLPKSSEAEATSPEGVAPVWRANVVYRTFRSPPGVIFVRLPASLNCALQPRAATRLISAIPIPGLADPPISVTQAVMDLVAAPAKNNLQYLKPGEGFVTYFQVALMIQILCLSD